MMNKTVFLYSGQGSQYPGMGKGLYEAFESVRLFYEEASALLGYDTAAKSFTESPDFNDTLYAQPLNFILQYAVTTLLARGISPDAAAGHSLGEYGALCCAGAFSFAQGIELLKSRSLRMQEAAKSRPGAMYAILKLTPEEVAGVCSETEGYVKPVNYNSPLQTVIAGEEAAAEAAAAKCREKGARVTKLAVNAAFHSALMKEAAEAFYGDIREFSFSAPSIPFYSNLNGDLMTDFSSLPLYLKDHLTSPVRFTDELAALKRDGFTVFIEIGPGKTLQGLVKKTLKDVQVFGVQDQESLEAALAALA